MNYYTENKRLSNTTPTKTVSEARRSERVAVQTGQTMTYKTLHRKRATRTPLKTGGELMRSGNNITIVFLNITIKYYLQ